jgi:predicted dehydrogenase
MIRYAVVGAGWISQEAFMPAVAATGNPRMQAIASGSRGLRSGWLTFMAYRKW